MFAPYFALTKINVISAPQSNTATANNVAVLSAGVTQTIVQAQSNSAVFHLG
jgi:hypothetical protein